MNGVILSDELKRETKVYRIIPYSRFVQLFTTKQNGLVRPKLWDDPFENLALNSVANIGGQIGEFGFKNDVYGQCWTLESASDAMWRIYSSGTDGIRIRSTVGCLLDSLSSASAMPQISCFVGQVRYLKERELNTFAATHFADGLGTDGRKLAETLLIKRKPFKHENEVRLIYASSDETKPEADLYLYSLDPDISIDQVLLHPQLTFAEAKWLKQSIRANTNWAGTIKQSMMYRPPKGFEFKIGP